MTDPQLALTNEIIKRLAPPCPPAERIAIAQQVIDEPQAFGSTGSYAVAMILCTARICEHDVTAQRAELQAIVSLAETHDLDDALHRLPTIERPTGDPEQDRCLALLLDGPDTYVSN